VPDEASWVWLLFVILPKGQKAALPQKGPLNKGRPGDPSTSEGAWVACEPHSAEQNKCSDMAAPGGRLRSAEWLENISCIYHALPTQ